MTASASIARDRLGAIVCTDRAVDAAVRAMPAATPKNAVTVSDVASSDVAGMLDIFGLSSTASGAVVNETTAMRVSAVYRAVSLIAGAIATIPCSFYRRTENGRESANDHPLWWLFNEQPVPLFTAAAFWEFCTAQMLQRGDGIAYIVRDGRYSPRIKHIVPVHRDKVTITRRGYQLLYTITDELEDGTVGSFTAWQDDVLHFPGMGFNGVHSLSVIGHAARQSIGIAIKADEHAAQTFGGGASIQYAVKSPKAMSPQQQESFRQAWLAKYGAGVGHSKIPLILTEGLDVSELSMTAADAQLLESRRFQVVDIARAYGVPPHMIGETTSSTSWGTGIEQMGQGFVRYTLRPHLHRFAQELNRKLFPVRDRYFVEFNVDGLLEGDAKTQGEFFGRALGGPGQQGWMTINEVRRLKNLPPVQGGDALIRAGESGPQDPAPPAPQETDQP